VKRGQLLLTIAVAVSGAAAAAGGCAAEPAPKKPGQTWERCQAGDQAFVRRATFGILGRQPWGQAEVNLLEDILSGFREAGLAEGEARSKLIKLLARDELYVRRWADFLTEALRVSRRVTSSYFGAVNAACWGPVGTPESAELAAWVRDHAPSDTGVPSANFTMASLVSSALVLDDLSPVYRAGLFQIVNSPIMGANVDALTLERSRRVGFGTVFEDAYLNRDVTCLPCHNSEFSATHSDDPEQNHSWAVPGYFEEALYGKSTGDDPLRHYSVFRFIDVKTGGSGPWGWQPTNCGAFQVPPIDDPLGIDALFGSVRSTPERPAVGRRASVWNLEYALRHGIDTIAQSGGIARDPDDPNRLVDADQAFAYLVALRIAERVWEEVIGSPLTIANHFPRTEAQRDTLVALADRFALTHFSLQELLAAIAAHPAFNLKPPSEGCGGQAYAMPRLLDPWTEREADPGARGNSAGDAVFAKSPRPLIHSLHTALGWPRVEDFPKGAEGDFQAALGSYMSSVEAGFRGLHLEARLVWEARYGRCSVSEPDFISGLVERGQAQGASVSDVVVALKDRLFGEPWLDEASTERAELETLLGAELTDTRLAELEPQLRLVCGALIASPQFMLGGLPAGKSTRDVPLLTEPGRDYDSLCELFATRQQAIDPSFVIECVDGRARVRGG
jgi:hypothetical protein